MNLTDHLKHTIEIQGPISISHFMAEALLHPHLGYYQQEQPFGHTGDFVTAPLISQVFGELLGIFTALIWQEFSSDPLQLIECGPGDGTLMDDLLRGTKHIPSFHDNLSLYFVEASNRLQSIQQEKLARWPIPQSWHNTIPKLQSKPTLFIANEFFDALPINQYQLQHGKWHERLIGLDHNNELCFTLSFYTVDAPANAPNKEGAIYEQSPATLSKIDAIAKILKETVGYALVIDYGFTTSSFTSTLQAVKNHQYHPILDKVGEADITAHVDFAAIKECANIHKLQCFGPINQGEFLEQLGIQTRTAQLVQNTKNASLQSLLLSATNRLIDPEEMGSLFKVLLLASNGLKPPEGITL